MLLRMQSIQSEPSRREALVDATADEIHREGYRSASTNRVIERVGVTKGALYYHFADKPSLAKAVLDERVAPEILGRWVPALRVGDPIDALIAITEAFNEMGRHVDLRLGCPLMNLAFTGFGEQMREAVDAVFAEWRTGVAGGLSRGQREGSVRADVDAVAEADFFVASLEGCIALTKSSVDPELMERTLGRLCAYTNGLRA